MVIWSPPPSFTLTLLSQHCHLYMYKTLYGVCMSVHTYIQCTYYLARTLFCREVLLLSMSLILDTSSSISPSSSLTRTTAYNKPSTHTISAWEPGVHVHHDSSLDSPEAGWPSLLASLLSSAASLRSFVAILCTQHTFNQCSVSTLTAHVRYEQYSLLHLFFLRPCMLFQQLLKVDTDKLISRYTHLLYPHELADQVDEVYIHTRKCTVQFMDKKCTGLWT